MTSPDNPAPCGGTQLDPAMETDVARLQAELSCLARRAAAAECMASIQRDAVQLALDLLVTHPDLRGFFRMFIKRLVDDSGAHACGVWLLDEPTERLRAVDGEHRRRDADGREPGWASLDLPRESMAAHLGACDEGRTAIVEYSGDDPRLPEPVRAFNAAAGVRDAARRAALLPPKTLGWIALSSVADSDCERAWLARPARRDRAAGDAGAAITAGWSSRACSRRGGRPCSKSATGSRATSTTRWRRASAPS